MSWMPHGRLHVESGAVMWYLEALPRLEAASRQYFHCLGLATASRYQSQKSQLYSQKVPKRIVFVKETLKYKQNL